MKTNKQSSISLSMTMGNAVGLVAMIIIFVTAVFLFTSHVSAQDFQVPTPPPPTAEEYTGPVSSIASPHELCQYYDSRWERGIYIGAVRDTENDCLYKISDGKNIGYVHAYYKSDSNELSGKRFCVMYSGAYWNSSGIPDGGDCYTIPQTGEKQQPVQQPAQQPVQQLAQNIPKLVTPPSFKIKQLQYLELPHGRPIESGDNERIELIMPDGSLIQIDANSTFTPVSDYEVQSVFGRYRYMWKPFHDGKCVVGQNLVRQECRKVITRDAIIGDRDTEFLVETDESGTTVTVLEGLLGVADLDGKTTVEVAGGQSVYIKHGGLPTDPTSFNPAEIDRWWEKKTLEQTAQETTNTIIRGSVILAVIFFLTALFVKRKQIFRSRKNNKSTLAAAAVTEGKKANHKGLAIASFAVGIFTAIASFCLFPWSFSVFIMKFRFILWNYRWNYSLFLFIAGIIGLILGIRGSRSSRKIFAIFGIILNIIGIIGILLWWGLSVATR